MLSAAALKAKLDRMFLEMVPPFADDDSDSDADAIAELKQDLESLYSEIPSVAEMAAEQEYLRPILKEVENGRSKAGEGLRVGGTYVSITSPNTTAYANTNPNLDPRCTATSTETKHRSRRETKEGVRQGKSNIPNNRYNRTRI